MPLGHTQHGIPICSIEDLPEVLREKLEREKYIKPWKVCRTCRGPADAYCKGCGHVGSYDKRRYCSRKCQKKDWPNHQIDCRVAQESHVNLSSSRLSALELRGQHLFHRQTERYLNAFAEAIVWATKQAYLSCQIKNRRNVCLEIELKWIVKDIQAPLWPSTFEFRPCNWAAEPTWRRGDESKALGFYALSVNGERFREGWVILDDRKEKLFPQWPWMLSQLTLMGDINPAIASVRLMALQAAFTIFRNPPGLLDEFNARGFTGKLEITPASAERWMELTYPVTAFIESRFHAPCDYARNKYGHLIPVPTRI